MNSVARHRRPVATGRAGILRRAVEPLELRQMFAVSPGYPQITFDSDPTTANTVSYDPATKVFDLRASSTSIVNSSTPGDIDAVNPPAALHVRVRVDANGMLLGGVAGVDDLLLTQDADSNPATPDVVLLRGEVRPGVFTVVSGFGSAEGQFELLGGTLAGAYQTSGGPMSDIGLTTSLDNGNVNLTNGFTNVVAKGWLGPVTQTTPESSLSGYVYGDCGNDGVRQAGDAGIAGVNVALYNAATNAFVKTVATDAAGKYTFEHLAPGTYRIVENPGGPLTAYLDGKDTPGTVNGVTRGTSPANDTLLVTLNAGEAGVEYDFAEVKPAALNGFVWLDLNDDGTVDFGEDGVAGVTVTLYKQSASAWVKLATDVTDAAGEYQFDGLFPGTYKIVETQPCNLIDGKDTLGTVGGVRVGSVANDVFCNVELCCDDRGIDYNFGERPPAGCAVRSGQTATIGFWHNKNGQALLRALPGGLNGTDLGNWLAGAFPNLYGNGTVNFAGKTNDFIASYYNTNDFDVKATQKLDAQVLAVAFAVFVTSSNLAGSTVASKYAFGVTGYGVGASTFNVGANGAAFGLSNDSNATVLDLLIAADKRSWNGRLWDANHSGITESTEQAYRNMASAVFTGINERGDIV